MIGMMKRIACGFLSFLLMVGVLSSCAKDSGITPVQEGDVLLPNSAENDINGKTYEPIAENGSLQLLVNRDTASFQVKNKKDGRIYQAVPENASSSSDKSLLEFTYMDSKGTNASMNSFDDSVKKGQFQIEPVENGMKITFTFGNVQEKLFVPPAFSVERFEEITGKIEKTFDKTRFKSQYYLADVNTITDEKAKSELLSQYPSLKEAPMYLLKQEVLSLSVQREIHRILVDTGYTEADYEKDMENAKELEQTSYPVFNMALYVTLDGERVDVRVPMGEIREFNGGTLLNLTVLKTFASPEMGETGRFLLPNGTGSLMNFYNGKESQQEFSVPVYGRDLSVRQDEKIYKENVAYLPLFAKIIDGQGAVLSVITEGDALAEVRAFPGSADSYAAAYPVFRVREVAKSYLSSASKEQGDYFSIAQKKLYDGDVRIQMTFFDKEHTALKDLAAAYASDLFDDKAEAAPAPLYLEFIGAAERETSFLGIGMKRTAVYTTLQDVLAIGRELKEAGVERLVIKLTGFLKGGLTQPFASGLKLQSGVGSQEDLRQLQAWAKEAGVTLYLDADVQYAYSNSLFDSLNLSRDVSSLLTKDRGIDYPYDRVTYQLLNTADSFRYILNPAAVDTAFQKTTALLDNLGFDGVSLRYAGTNANADYKENRLVERQTAMKRLTANVKSMAESRTVSTLGANAPILPVVQDVLDVPMKGYQYDICDEVVPFLQMVMNGHVRYGDEARNLSGNTDESLLDTLRTGGGLSFTLTANESLTFEKTEYLQYYSTKYSFWKDEILRQYRLLDESAAAAASGIAAYDKLGDGLYKTTFGDGSSMLTNYSGIQQQAEGRTIPAGACLLVKGGTQ